MKHGVCQRDQSTTRRCRRAATHLVAWTIVTSDRPFARHEFLCELDAQSLAASLERAGKQPRLTVLD